ncbi:MAG: tRNA (adenine-N1)-methyltransferase [bacterium]
MIKEGDIIKIISVDDIKKQYLKKVKKGIIFEDHKRNKLTFDDVINKNYGTVINNFIILKPTVEEFILYYLKRKTQIIYPKDSAYLALKLGINSNSKILEISVGSGAMSIVLLKHLYPNGLLVSIDKNLDFILNAKKNIMEFCILENIDYLKNVFFINFDIFFKNLDDIFKIKFNSCILDIPELDDIISKVFNLLENSGTIGIVLPTVNQVIQAIEKLKLAGFCDIEVEEILLRKYKTNYNRLRPNDIMTAHTAYIITAKKFT